VAAFLAVAALAEPRDLVLTGWDPALWAARPDVSFEAAPGRTPSGEPLTRITFRGAWDRQDLLARVNLPPSAGDLSVFIRRTDPGPARQEALVEDVHGWVGAGQTLWAAQADTVYRTPALKPSWTWRIGFYKAQADPPFAFRGFRLQAPEAGAPAAGAVTWEVGPVHVSYEPDDARWLYADLQPKTVAARDGVVPDLRLRVANLGTKPRAFRLCARVLRRNLDPASGGADLGAVTLAPGEARELTAHLPLRLLGRYELQHVAATADDAAATFPDRIAVVNARDLADGFRGWAARRKWFSAPDRRPGDRGGTAVVTITAANNGLSDVPLFPVQGRVPRPDVALAAGLPGAAGAGGMTVLATQLSPAWLAQTAARELVLFGGTRPEGLGPPTRLAFATAGGTRVLAAEAGASADAGALRAMSRPWLLVWWQGAEGWTQWDAPYLVTLQRRPTAMALTADGLRLTFAGPAGYFTVMPLYGYAKLPQQAAWERDPSPFGYPPGWPAEDLRPWRWERGLPASVAARCDWWAEALTRFPYRVMETYRVNHRLGAVEIRDRFDYVAVVDDWGTRPRRLAPLSPTYCLALRAGFPMAVQGKLTDLQYPTLFGPYCAMESASEVRYSLKVGPYLMQAADPNPAPPPDAATAARRAQAALLSRAMADTMDDEAHAWDYVDENFVWYAQTEANRFPAMLTGYVAGSLRADRKAWLQARTLHSLLDAGRYKMDERAGALTRRYIDGPGIGNWGSSDWGDSGKLGTDMICDAYAYAYATGDYQTIADYWDLITSLDTLPATMSWAGVGRASIAEMGDEAPPMLALARLAYAVGDRETYAAAAYWFARELVLHVVKEGGFTRYMEQVQPWHPGWKGAFETASNLWGTNASWQGGGLRTAEGGENQWGNFYVRLDDPDALRFHRRYATELPRRVATLSTPAERRGSYPVYFARVCILGEDPDAAAADFSRDGGKPPPDSIIRDTAAAWREFPPRLETLIPPAEPPVADTAGFAWSQMNNGDMGLVSPAWMAKGRPPTITWFWWKPPLVAQGVDAGDRWSFGALDTAAGLAPDSAAQTAINPMTGAFTYAERR
jgi:hypothetical protein